MSEVRRGDPVDKKFCKKCQRWKSRRTFSNDPTREDGKYPWCRYCRSAYNKVARASNKASEDNSKSCVACGIGVGGSHANVRYCSDRCKNKAALARSYGLSIDEYSEIVSSTEGKCPICLKNVLKWQMDHDHETGETFGPVCTMCNTKLLAFTFHDPEIAARLVEFLTRPPVRERFGPRFVTQKRETSTRWGTEARALHPGSVYHGSTRGGRKVRKKRKP